jgi:hypothetical protein
MTLREAITPAKWSARVTSLPYSKSASNEVYKTKKGLNPPSEHIVTAKIGRELVIIYLNNYNKEGS